MTVVERINGYFNLLCTELGITPDKVYNEKNGAWYFSFGSSTIEVFLTSQKNPQNQDHAYIRCIAGLREIPQDLVKQYRLFRTALEINSTYLGYKISADAKRNLLCIISERNIQGMSYDEMVIVINDLAAWADKLTEFLNAEFQ